jgi:uncharacterized ParB-like nuclease family protein/Zn finger protein HypA/HybF involved in hydrogenase expression
MAVLSRRTRRLKLQDILRDSRVQSREAINLTVVSEYATAMAKAPVWQEAGLPVEPFPPVVVYHEEEDGKHFYWLADGWHRILGAEEAGLDSFDAVVHEGGILDAIMHAAGSNGKHGLKRTQRDKHRAVRMLLDHPTVIREEWGDSRVAHAADVSAFLARTVRREREQALGLPPSTERRGSDGKLYSLQLRKQPAPKNPDVGVEAGGDQKTAPESFSDDFKAFLHQCSTAGCEAVTTEESWHCGSCGAHLPVRDYPIGTECPVCVDDPLAVPLDVLARVEDRELPKTERNGAPQVPYTPGHLKPESALLAYERLRAAIEIIESLEGCDFQQIAEQAPDFDQFVEQVRGARTALDAMQASLRLQEVGRR